MDFNDLLHDIAKLEGLHLSSIRPGADIVVEKVDIEHGKVLVKNASGKLFSRSVIEFQKIWEGLNTEPAVRVEEILRGSGSSRNQPETIMANLPYIEWLKITNKKHISYVGKQTHPFGTLKQMSGMGANKISDDFSHKQFAEKLIIMVSSNYCYEDVSSFSSRSGISPVALSVNEYKFSLDKCELYFVNSEEKKVLPGVYTLMNLRKPLGSQKTVDLNGRKFFIESFGEFQCLIEDTKSSY